jgi:hypothetical protein
MGQQTIPLLPLVVSPSKETVAFISGTCTRVDEINATFAFSALSRSPLLRGISPSFPNQHESA